MGRNYILCQILHHNFHICFYPDYLDVYKRQGLTNPNNMESLGNKSILEKKINIRASDYRFSDKIKYYHCLLYTSRCV